MCSKPGRGVGHRICSGNLLLIAVVICYLFVRQVFDMDGNFRFRFGSPGSRDGHFQFPSGVAVTSEGNIVVADSMNNRIQVTLVLTRLTQ